MAFFVAFYSYKGGVGRTLALANVAYSLASRGKRVVMIDMDLEAPALLGFPRFALKGKTPKKGFLEYAASYRKRGVCPAIKGYVHECRSSPGTGRLWLMPSGRIDSSYQKKLAGLPWRCLHPRKGTPPLAEDLRQALVEELDPHYVLIDSRTGLSDIGGLSTHLLADMVVMIFNLTRECIEGSIRAYRAFTSGTTKVRGAIQLVAAPIPPVAAAASSVIADRLRQAKEHMPRAVTYGREIIRILYDPSMALAEELAVVHPEIYAAAERYENLSKAIQRGNEEEVLAIVEEAHRKRSEGRWEEGLRQLQAFADRYPENVEGYLELGNFLLEAGRAQEAVTCFRNATKLDEELALAHRKLGDALAAAGQAGEAVASLEQARELGDDSPEIFEALSAVYAELATEYSEDGGRSPLVPAALKALEAQWKALLSARMMGMGRYSLVTAENLEALREKFITTLSHSPPFRTFDAREVWELLANTQALTTAQKHVLANSLLQGKPTIAQTIDMIRLLREEESPPVDLEIHITTEPQPTGFRLHYVLNSVGGKIGYTHYRIEGPRIPVGSEKYQSQIRQALEKLESGYAFDGSPLLREEASLKLEALGRTFYHELFPSELKLAYRNFRARVSRLLIVSDEPWIPWELIKPYDHVSPDEVIDDDFLCCRFELSRWLAGKTAPAAELRGSRITCIAPSDAELPHRANEARFLGDLAGQFPGVQGVVLSLATLTAVDEALQREGNAVLHFVGHSSFDSTLSGPILLLSDGLSLSPTDLYGPAQSQIRKDRPLVFLNACRAGRNDWSLSGLGGWVSRWIHDCGCGAFLGPQWNIDDFLSYRFATAFYDALATGATVPAAVRKARLWVRAEAPESTAWLAYAVYAHPNARLRLGPGRDHLVT